MVKAASRKALTDKAEGTVEYDPSIGVLRTLAGYHLRRAANAFSASYTQALSNSGMRQGLFGILSVLRANPGIKQGAAGRVLGIQRANMVALIGELVDHGFVSRNASPNDKRAFALHLTANGEAALDDYITRVEAHENRMLAGFSTSERATLIALLERIEAHGPETESGPEAI